MKKRIITYIIMFFISAICFADYKTDYATFEMIAFKTYYKKTDGTISSKPKAPAKAPTVYLNNHELLFESDMTGYGIEILSAEDEETVIFEDVITDGNQSFMLPENLSGEYLIKLTHGNLYYIGEIML